MTEPDENEVADPRPLSGEPVARIPNDKSRVAARRLGFRFKKNRDTAWYSTLEDEWPEVRQHIRHWLHDDNFDEHGNAKHALSALMQEQSPSTRRLNHE